jgi:hypothetical protein
VSGLLLAYLFAWFCLLIIAVINGAVRDKVYGPQMSELAAHQISCVAGIILFAVFIWFFTGLFPIGSSGQAVLIGGMWLVMTLAFEFGFFHYVGGKPWSQLLGDYNILNGRLWPLALVWTAIAPWVFWRVRN